MTRSRRRKLNRVAAAQRATLSSSLAQRGRVGVGASVLMLAGIPAAYSQESTESAALPEVTVTAQKRTEDLQTVPLSIQALSTKTLEDQHVSSFLDYAKLLPSVTFQDGVAGGGAGGPGFARVYMRGVASGGDGNHSASQPSVGMYLDEQPITTIQGSLDIHIYDIARVEALAGPQGTLYGASSQAGTIRIITNKPDPRKFDAGYNLEGSLISWILSHVCPVAASQPSFSALEK